MRSLAALVALAVCACLGTWWWSSRADRRVQPLACMETSVEPLRVRLERAGTDFGARRAVVDDSNQASESEDYLSALLSSRAVTIVVRGEASDVADARVTVLMRAEARSTADDTSRSTASERTSSITRVELGSVDANGRCFGMVDANAETRVIVWDAHGRLLYVDDAFERASGRSAREITIATTALSIVLPKDARRLDIEQYDFALTFPAVPDARIDVDVPRDAHGRVQPDVWRDAEIVRFTRLPATDCDVSITSRPRTITSGTADDDRAPFRARVVLTTEREARIVVP